jgi:hypothetical protein
MAATNTTTQGQANPASLQQFRHYTRQNVVNVGNLTFNAFGAPPQQLQLPRSGWLARVYVTATATMTTGAGTPSGNWATYPTQPYSLLGKVRLYTNTQSDLFNISGHGLNLFSQANYGMTKVTRNQGLANATNLPTVYQTLPSTTPAASTAYPMAATYKLPVVTDDALMLGMLFLQSDAVTFGIEITPPASTDIVGTVSGVTVTPAITYSVTAEYFDVPYDRSIMPNSSYAHLVQEQFKPISVTGQNDLYMLTGNTYLKIIGQLENNSVPMVAGNIVNVGVKYAQTTTPYYEPYPMHVTRTSYNYGGYLPDGLIIQDFSLGSGIPSFLEPRDFINSSLLSDFEIFYTLNNTMTLTNARARIITEQLAPIGAS